MKINKLISTLSLSFTLVACGPSMRTITLLTPIPVRNPTKELSKIFSQMNGITNPDGTLGSGSLPNSCPQDNFSVVTQSGGEGAPLIAKKFQIQTEILPTGNILENLASGTVNSASDWLNSHSALSAPITLSIPSNQSYTLAIRGVMDEPTPMNAPGVPCVRAGLTNRIPFLVYERRSFPSNSPNVLFLRPNVLKAALNNTSYTIPTPPGAPGSPVTLPTVSGTSIQCRDAINPRTCANLDVLQLFFSSAFTNTIQSEFANPFIGYRVIRLRQTISEIEEVIPATTGVNPNTTATEQYAYVNTLSNYLIRYQTSTGLVSLKLDPKAHTLTYPVSGIETTQTLTNCNGTYSGNLPTVANPNPGAAACGSSNFQMKDLGDNFY